MQMPKNLDCCIEGLMQKESFFVIVGFIGVIYFILLILRWKMANVLDRLCEMHNFLTSSWHGPNISELAQE